jgi:para-nitrobenzyl esterase
MPGAGMIRMPTVVADGVVLPREDPLESLARADGHNVVPVIIGTNRDENKLFMFNDPTWVRRWLWIVPRLRDPAHYEVTAEYLSKLWQATGADEPATRLREVQPDVFVYRFDWHEEPTVLGADLAVMLGAAHGFEIPFVFGHFDLGREADVLFDRTNAPGRASLSAEMMSYWAAFAYDGRPGRGRHGDLPEWGRWEGGTPHFLVLDTPAGGGLRPSGETVTRSALLASLAADPRAATPAERCAIMRDMVLWTGSVTRAEYAERCPEVPLDVAAR